jgi:hypothetical protein
MSHLASLTRAASALILALWLSAETARADTVDPFDPLHGCVSGNCTEFNNSGNPYVPAGSANPTFEFGLSGSKPFSGLYFIDIIVPTTDLGAGSQSYSIQGTNPTIGPRSISSGYPKLWTSGDLGTFLGFPDPSPANPIGNFQTISGASSFEVYQFALGTQNISPENQTSKLINLILASGSLLKDSFIVAFLENPKTGQNCDSSGHQTCGTALSGAIFYPGSGSTTPLPGALPLFAGGLGLIGFAGWCKKRKTARLAV